MISRLIVVGGGSVELRDSRVFAKCALANYLHSLRQFFAEVVWITWRNRRPVPYTTELDPSIVEFREWSLDRASLLSPRAIVGLGRLLLDVDARTAVLVNLPNPALAPLLPILRKRAGVLALYIGSDWVAQADARHAAGRRLRARFERWGMRVALRCADHVLVRGPLVAAHARQDSDMVIESEPILFTSRPGLPRAARSGVPIVLYVGKLERGKGVFCLLDAAAALLHEHGRTLRFRFAGSGRDVSELQTRVRELAVEDSIEFVGYIDDKAALDRLYREATVVVMPSIDPEGMPRVVDEALLFGVPVVATPRGGLPAVYAGCDEVRFVAAGDSAELAAVLGEIVQNSPRWVRMQTQALLAASRYASRPSAAEQHARLLLGRTYG